LNDLFLSEAELVKLTGYAWKSKQIQWLKAEAIPFRTAATGHPVVTRAAIEGGQPVHRRQSLPRRARGSLVFLELEQWDGSRHAGSTYRRACARGRAAS
jgi:hypothetical protein